MKSFFDRFVGAFCALILACCFVGVANAQTVTLSVTPASGVSPVTPVATWSTTPAASSCTASGAWSGAKAASGTQTLPAISASATYTLTCSFGSTGSATVNWTAPTTNTNGTPLTNLAGFRVVYGTSAGNLSNTRNVAIPSATSLTITGLAPGTWHFGVIAYNTAGAESDLSNVPTKTIAPSVSRSATASVTVTQPPDVPNPPTNVLVTVEQVVFDLTRDGRGWRLSRHVANLPLGSKVVRRYTVTNASGMCQVDRQSPGIQHVKASKGVLVAKCA